MAKRDKKKVLTEELVKLEKKVEQLLKDVAEMRGGSRYGDEYGEIQIKVYEQMISDVRKELLAFKA